MTASVFKQQAARLAEHLSAVHKTRLKHASSLEAVAALHGAKDWNTLIAQGLGSTALPQEHRAESWPATSIRNLFADKSFNDAQLREAVLSTVTLMSGGPVAERNILCEQLLAHQIKRGGFLYLDLAGDSKLGKISEAMASAGKIELLKVVDFAESRHRDTFNPLEDMSATEMATAICNLISSKDRNPGSDFYRQQTLYALSCVIPALISASGRSLALSDLAEFFRSPEAEVSRLALELGHEHPELQQLSQLLTLFQTKSEKGHAYDWGRFTQSLGGVAGRLAMFTQREFSTVLSAYKGSCSLFEAVTRGQGVHIALRSSSSGTSRSVESLILANLASVLNNAAVSGHPPFTVFIVGEQASALLTSELANIAQKVHVGIILVDPELIESNDPRSPWELSLQVEPAQGFGATAMVQLEHVESGRTQVATLENRSPWKSREP